MSIFDTIKQLVGAASAGFSGVDKLKSEGQKLAGQYRETVNEVVDNVQSKVPGTAGDNYVDAAQDKLDRIGADQ